MTRETKAGIVVSCSFLGLVGVVLFSKLGENLGAMPEAADQNSSARAEAPAEPQAVNTRDSEPLRMGESSLNRPSEGKGGVVPANLALDDHNMPPARPANEGTLRQPPATKPPAPALEEPSFTLPGTASAPAKPRAGEKGLAEKTPPPPSWGREDVPPTPAKPVTQEPVRSPSEPTTNLVLPLPGAPNFDTKPVVPADGHQDHSRTAGSDSGLGKSSPPPVPALEMPPPPVLNPESSATSKGPAAASGEPRPQGNSTGAPPPPDLSGFGTNPATSTGNSKEPMTPPAIPTTPAPAPLGAGPIPSPGATGGPAPGNQTPPLDTGAGLVPPVTKPAIKPLGADQPPRMTTAPEPQLPPLGATPSTQPAPGRTTLDTPGMSPAPAAPPAQPPISQPLPTPTVGSPSTRPMPPLGAAPIGSSSAPVPSAVPASPTSPPAGIAVPAGLPRSSSNQEPQVDSYDEEVYIWKPSDTFQSISQKAYQTDRYGRALLLFNRNHPLAQAGVKQEPPQLQPGQELYIPPTRILEKYYAVGISDASNTSQPAAPTPTSNPAPTRERTYRVQGNGEMFLEIARRALGNAERWPEIYRLNPRFDPSQAVPAGSDLVLPAQ